MNKNLMTTTTIAGIAIVSVLSSTGEVEAMSNTKMQVYNTNSLKILSMQDQKKTVEVLSNGTIVSIISSMKNQPGWYYVQTPSGKKGVCSGLYLKSVNSQTQTNTSQSTYYTKTSLNLRKGMGTQYSVITTMPNGAKVELISSSNGWAKVKYNGSTGYCSMDYLTKTNTSSQTTQSSTKTYYATTDNLKVRTGAGTSYSIYKSINTGTAVNVISNMSNGWSKVSMDGKTLYISTSYLSTTKPSSGQTTQTSTKTYYATTDNLKVRTGAGTSYSIYKSINTGTAVNVISNMNNGWSKVSMDGKTLYISTSYLSTTKPSSTTTTQTSTKTYYVTTDNLNIRTGAGTSYSIYKKVNTGTAVNVISNMSNGWSKISMDGKTVYASTSYLSTTKPSSTTYSYSVTATVTTTKSKTNSIKNVINAFKKIDGKIIKPGETFSYLGTIGSISKANGFVESDIISGGKVSTGVGGGVCLGSTAIHNAVMKSGLTVTERRNHSLPSSYVKKGMDAMVTSSNNLDYKFKNTSSYPVRIRCYVSNNQAVVKIESTGNITNGYTFEPETEVYGNGLKATTTVWRVKNGKKVDIHQKFYSSYRSA